MEKVIVTKEVADCIEDFLSWGTTVMKRSTEEAKAVLASEHCGQDWQKYERGQYAALNDITTFDLMRALVNGYEVEKTPEEKVAAYYEELREEFEGEAMAVVASTLNLLGIKIEGVNA